MRLSPLPAVLAAALLAAVPTPGAAQAVTIAGASVERFAEGGGHFVAFTYRRTDISRRAVGLDLAVGVVPQALAARTVLLQVDAGFAAAVPVGPAFLVLKGGVGNFLAVGPSPELYPGLQAGVAAIIPLERRCALRLDLTRHVYFPDGDHVRLWSLGVGLAVLPVRRTVSAR